uniref:Three-finger toxin MALT0057C n=1 Tax=Micrurus altirostris TaxID=129457 RepID=3S157_MICAT|nr:RecName: Full=Three-finger toxin MALT0057C; AltName: Full=MALT0057C; Flags: Precursor [Micrurus altirostris]AED89565.1 putative three finger toxin precursor [Micrurus altirostris]
MKTLLLTLVVVTIVCLDFGHTMICYNQQSSQPPTTTTCSEGQCYKQRWRDHRGWRTERGCGCPKAIPEVKLNCCKTDRCNG